MEQIIVAVLSMTGTLIGSLFGILASNRLTNYRIAQLEKKVDKHNQVVERMQAAELHIQNQQQQINALKEKESA